MGALDVNGDGKLDLVSTFNFWHLDPNLSPPIRVLLGNGAGGFSDGTAALLGSSVPGIAQPRQVLVADFNSDGRSDVFVAATGYDEPPWPGEKNALLLSSGATGFINATANLPSLNAYTHSAASGDIDGDGDVDLFVNSQWLANYITPYMLINDGAGHFTKDTARLPAGLAARDPSKPGSFPNYGLYTATIFFDADGDGDQDLFIGTGGGDASSISRILLNDGHGAFNAEITNLPKTHGTIFDQAVYASAMDIDGDGRQDLMVSWALDLYRSTGQVQLLMNKGAGVFVDEAPARLPSGGVLTAPGSTFNNPVTFIDINGDGAKDILLGTDATTPMLLNDGFGKFYAIPAGVLPVLVFQHLTPGDFNGDGRLDFAVYTNSSVSDDFTIFMAVDAGGTQTGDEAANGFMGDAGDESFSGFGGDDLVFAGAGNDTVDGGAGADTLIGGLGDDLITTVSGANIVDGDAGADTIMGGAGPDTVRGLDDNDSVDGGAGGDDLNGNRGADTVRGGAGADLVRGGQGADLVFGDDGDDWHVNGNIGDDVVHGGSGDDTAYGGQGADTVHGDDGNDRLSGDLGNDILVGGPGADRFAFARGGGVDWVADFNGAEGDRIELAAGTAYSVVSLQGQVGIDLGGGDTIGLSGVSVAAFNVAWIVFA